MLNISDQEILEGIKTGDDQVIKCLIRIYFPKIKNFILKNKGTINDAEDVLQETLIIIYEKIRKTELKINSKFETYLYGIGKILWIKELKNRGRSENIETLEDTNVFDAGLFNQLEKRERQKIYRDYFNKLGDECKRLLQYFFNGMKIKEITQIMGYNSEQHTKNKKYICKKNLIENIRSNPKFKEIKNERLNNLAEIPRW